MVCARDGVEGCTPYCLNMGNIAGIGRNDRVLLNREVVAEDGGGCCC